MTQPPGAAAPLKVHHLLEGGVIRRAPQLLGRIRASRTDDEILGAVRDEEEQRG